MNGLKRRGAICAAPLFVLWEAYVTAAAAAAGGPTAKNDLIRAFLGL